MRTSIAGSAALMVLLLASSASPAALMADYRFEGTFASSVLGAADLTPIAQGMPPTTGTFSSETVDGTPNVPVFTFSGNRGLIADTAGLVAPDSYSVVFYARLSIAGPSGMPPLTPLVKILDFKNRTSDAGQYVVGGVPTFYDGLLPVLPGAGLFVDDQYAQFVLTRDVADAVNVYLDGAPLFSFTDAGGLTMLDQNLLTLFADDPNSAGVPTGLQIEAAEAAIARLRLYDGVLSPGEVAALESIVPESRAVSWLAMVVMLGGALWRRRLSNNAV